MMSKCIKCGKAMSEAPKLYGVIEKYHYDNRTTTADTDTGATTFDAVAIINSAICEDCLKLHRKKLILHGLKDIGIGLLVMVVGGLAGNLIEEAGGVIALLGLIGMIYGCSEIVRAFQKKNIIESAFEGKISEEFVVWPKDQAEIDIEELPVSTYYRDRFYYKFIDEKKLREPIKANANENSKADAMNTLKKALIAIETGSDPSLEASQPEEKTVEPASEVKDKNTDFVKTGKKKIANILKNKKLMRIVAVALAVCMIPGIIIAIIDSTKVPTINLNDFLEIEERGYDGAGRLEISIDITRLYNYNEDSIRFRNHISSKDVSSEAQREFIESFARMKDHTNERTAIESIEFVEYEQVDNLRNGDTVYYQFNDNLCVIEKIFKCKFDYFGGTYTMCELPSRKDVDFFDVLDSSYLTFEGTNGNGKAVFAYKNSSENTMYRDDDYFINSCPDEVNSFVLYSSDGKQLKQMNMVVDNNTNLSNGDIVTIRFSSGTEGFADYGFVPERTTIDVRVSGLGSYIESGEAVNRQMLKDYIIKQEAELNGADIGNVDVQIRSAIFFKMPKESESEESTIICVDYDMSYDVNHQIVTARLGMIYNPSVGDALSADRFDVDYADNLYVPFEEEFEIVDVDVDIKDYGQLLKILASDDMQLLIDAGLEDADYVDSVLYCFVNDDTYYINN